MDFLDPNNPKDIDLVNFVGKIQNHLKKLKIPMECQNEHASCILRESKASPDDTMYGNIGRADIELLLSEYDRKSLVGSTTDEPITCHNITGKSYAKLLHSKHGFHNPASATILAEKLGINNTRMDSFLGGHSTYSVKEGEDVFSLRKRNRASNVRAMALRFHKHLVNEEDKDRRAATLELDNMLKLDPKDSNSLACRGLLSYSKGQHAEAATDLREAIKGQIEEAEQVREKLVTSLYELGMKHFNSFKYKEAITNFDEALKHDPKHAGSDLHRRLAHDKLNSRVGVRGPYGVPRK